MSVGKSVARIDAFDKVTGRAKYVEDIVTSDALVAKILHSTIANGVVKNIDVSEAEKVKGVVKIVTCFDVPDFKFPTAGHPWSTLESHQDVADKYLLAKRIRYYGDDVAAVIAEDDVSANQALRAIKVEYEEYPFVLCPKESMRDGAPQLHDDFKNNILGETHYEDGDYFAAIKEPGLIVVEGDYETPIVQHCHIENAICYASMQNGKMEVVASTQIPHIVRRVVGQALGMPWGKVRVIKPYIGGGFGNKQDVLYEPLCAYLSQCVGGRLVKLDNSREETFATTRVRHAVKYHITSHVRKDGTFAARRLEAWSNQGAYASHGHGVLAKGATGFRQLYRSDACKGDAYTVFTNSVAAGAMRGYGIPQAMFSLEGHMDDVAKAIDMDPMELRVKNMLEAGFQDDFYRFQYEQDSLAQCVEVGKKEIKWDEKRELYKNQTGPIRRGIGMAIFWYNTAVWPISLEATSCRMVLNQDGSLQLQMAETEIGQGADTAFAQMTADAVGIPFEDVYVVSTQDTDVTPFGLGAYASRQTYVGGLVIKQTADILRKKILAHAQYLTRMPYYTLDLIDAKIIQKSTGKTLLTLEEVAMDAFYSLDNSIHLTAESTYQCRSNALSLGCSFAEVEVDIPLCKVKLLNLVNVHDCGKLINPALAEAQVHGGMSMAIGFGMSEQLIYDPKTGKPLNNNLLDYKLSTTMDHSDLTACFVENHEPTSAFGTKALGEPPTVSGAPAIRNAVLNASGVSINKAPLSPHVLFTRFKEEGLI